MKRPHRQHLVRRKVRNQGYKVYLRSGTKFRKEPRKSGPRKKK